jgi:hypothetical protein
MAEPDSASGSWSKWSDEFSESLPPVSGGFAVAIKTIPSRYSPLPGRECTRLTRKRRRGIGADGQF